MSWTSVKDQIIICLDGIKKKTCPAAQKRVKSPTATANETWENPTPRSGKSGGLDSFLALAAYCMIFWQIILSHGAPTDPL